MLGLDYRTGQRPSYLRRITRPGGYGGVLYQEEKYTGAKPKLVPVGCVSTTKTRKLNSEVEHALAATLYCLSKFRDWVATAPSILVKVPVAGV